MHSVITERTPGESVSPEKSVAPAVIVIPRALPGPAVFAALRLAGEGFFLDSALVHPRLGKRSFVGSGPFLTFRSHGARCSITHRGGPTVYVQGNPLAVLQSLLKRYSNEENDPGFPLGAGGAAGYFSYDLGRSLERLPVRTTDDLGLPECIMGFYDRGVVIDHSRDETYLFSTGLPVVGAGRLAHRDARLKELNEILQPVIKGAKTVSTINNSTNSAPYGRNLRPDITKDAYLRAVEQSLDYIARGDIYQVNFTQRFKADLEAHPWDLYLRLRELNPAPFAAYLEYPEGAVVSSSPERFIKQEGGYLETRPIKGTRRRGQTPEEDELMRRELWESKKDRAELTMIIDLERNDLSRVCKEGTVQVPELFTLEEYATVYHLVSTVTGELPEGRDMTDVLRGTFPGGSITGAPKIRAMEIIEELESVRRGIYTGSIGYIDFAGRADLNIVIRTIIATGGRAYLQVGGGIVADSRPEDEYRETLDKARALLRALGFEQ